MRTSVFSLTSPAATPQDPVRASSTDPDIRPLRAAHACTYAKDLWPSAASGNVAALVVDPEPTVGDAAPMRNGAGSRLNTVR